jgi:hypothetical protein
MTLRKYQTSWATMVEAAKAREKKRIISKVFSLELVRHN